MKLMSKLAVAMVAAACLAPAALAQGTPAPAAAKPANYVPIAMSIDVNKPAAEVWAKVGADFCGIKSWIAPGREVPCVITSGNGEVGTVRTIAGRVVEIMTAKSEFGYGYTQPAVEGKWYNHYHGFMEVRPVTATTSKIYYTLMQDQSDKADQAGIDANVKQLRGQFEGALANMKKMAEG